MGTIYWKRRIVLGFDVVLMLLAPALTSAQVEEVWSRVYNSGGNDGVRVMGVDLQGNVYVSGFASASNANNSIDLATVKYRADGTEAWIRRYDGPGHGYDFPAGIAVSSAGEVWVTSASEGAGGILGYATIKYSTDGIQLWVSRLEGQNPDATRPAAIVVDASGNAYVTGAIGTTDGYADVATVKYSPAGQQLWVRYYDGPHHNYDGGAALALDASGNVMVGGNLGGAGDPGVTIKYSADGDVLWTASFASGESYISGLAVDPAGCAYVAGWVRYVAGPGENHCAVLKYDPAGAVLWTRFYEAPPGWWSGAGKVKLDSNGNAFLAASSFGPSTIWPTLSQESIITVKFDSAGRQLWAARYNGLPYVSPEDLQTDSLGNAYVIGTAVLTNHYAFVPIKYSPDGDQLWLAPQPAGRAFAGALDGAGNLLVAGQVEYSNPPSPLDSYDFLTVKYAQSDTGAELRAFVDPFRMDSPLGSNAAFNVTISGTGPFTYQWRFNGVLLSNETNATLSFTNVQLTNAGDYSVIVSTPTVYTITPEARLAVHPPLTIISKAQTNTVLVGDDLTWTVAVSGEPPFFFQWQFNATNLPGAINASLSLTNLQESPQGLFTVIVSNAFLGPIISQPYQIRVVPPSLTLNLVGSWPGSAHTNGSAAALRVAGRYAYLADGRAGLQVIDVNDPAHPNRVGGCCAEGWASDVDVVGNRAYVADLYAGLRIIDISDPANPVQLGSFDTGIAGGRIAEGPNTIQVVSNLAYVVDGDLQIVNLSNPTNPVLAGVYAPEEGYAYGIYVSGKRAYFVGSITGGDDDDMGFLQILDLTEPTHPVRLGSTRTAGYAHGVAVAGQYAYVAGECVVLTVVDVSNPVSPFPIGEFNTLGWAEAVQIVGNRAYLGLPDPGLFVVDVTNPADPFRLAEYHVGKEDDNCDVHVIGNHAYVARGSSGLLVFEITETPGAISVTRVGNDLVLAWNGAPGLKLRRTASLSTPNWTDVPGSDGQSQATLSIRAGNEFFRLMKP